MFSAQGPERRSRPGLSPLLRLGGGLDVDLEAGELGGQARVLARSPQNQGFAGPPRDQIANRQMNCRFADAGTRRRPKEGQPYSAWEAGLMSILKPVSLAARRAFWPSLPIARLS